GNTALHLVLLELKDMEGVLSQRVSIEVRKSVLRKYPTKLMDFLKQQDRFIQLAQKLVHARSPLRAKNKGQGGHPRQVMEGFGLDVVLRVQGEAAGRSSLRRSLNTARLGRPREARQSSGLSVSM